MSKTASEYLVEALEKTGVKRIYGVVGDSLNGVSDALRRRKSIDWIHMRHEEAGAFAAGAEAHLTGNLAVCAGSCGPGNLHLINGLFDCQRNGVPVLAIAAHIPSSEIGIDYFQATHPESLFKDCSHYVELVSNPEAAAADSQARHPGRRRQAWRRRRRHTRRRRADENRRRSAGMDGADRARDAAQCRRYRASGAFSQQSVAGDAVLRRGMRRRA